MTDTQRQATTESDDVLAVPLRHPWRWASALVLGLLFAWLAVELWNNQNIDHATIGNYLFNSRILSGAVMTVFLTFAAMAVSTVLGVLVAGMKLSANPVLSFLAWFYVWVFRGSPLLVQIVFWGYLGLLFSEIVFGVPMTDIVFLRANTNALIPPLVAGLIALTLNQTAYSAEIIRAGLLSVDSGQREAAYSLGMSPLRTFSKIVLPQAMRVIIPPMGNETISMLKDTSLLSVIAVLELYTAATRIASQNLRQVELLLVITIWYVVMTTALSIPQHYLEKRFGRGTGAQDGILDRTLSRAWSALRRRSDARG
ncbi:MAG: transporter permease [Naasia sp.]|jgi:polar amino acid transport system permease protein|uniref:amino acid ABC transporter permease n=1 Tax=Naasia sp. TaxID=2546198 RepID=UPI00260A8570|nr:amino acid ABC transporter permease [Naasia sp.]MCU1570028.1 transporter permease [Naasia sp.]